MAKITESIDLTLNCLFAGETSPRLLPMVWQRHHTGFKESWRRFFKHHTGFDDIREHLNQLFPNHELERFFAAPELNTTGFYIRMFQDLPGAAHEELFGFAPNVCLRCGERVNLLTKNKIHDLCEPCAQAEWLQGRGGARAWTVFSVTS